MFSVPSPFLQQHCWPTTLKGQHATLTILATRSQRQHGPQQHIFLWVVRSIYVKALLSTCISYNAHPFYCHNPTDMARVKTDGQRNTSNPEEKKKRRYKPGTIRTKQNIKKAIKAERAVPKAVLRRMIMEVMMEEGTPLRWTSGAVTTLETVVQSRVQRVLALGSTLSRCANKATLTDTHIELAHSIVSELVPNGVA